MELTKITIDPILLTYVAQALGRVPERLEIVRGDFSLRGNRLCILERIEKLKEPQSVLLFGA